MEAIIERAAGPALDEKTRMLMAQLSVVEALLNDAPLYSLAGLLAQRSGLVAPADCSSELSQKPSTPTALAAVLLRRVLLDGAPFETSRDHYVRLIEHIIGQPLSNQRRAAAERLLVSLQAARTLEIYVTRRKQLMQNIEQQDVDRLKSAPQPAASGPSQ